MMHHQQAKQVFRYRTAQGGVTVEMVVWALPVPSADRHYGDREESYRFESLEKLLEDFRADCTRLAGWRWR